MTIVSREEIDTLAEWAEATAPLFPRHQMKYERIAALLRAQAGNEPDEAELSEMREAGAIEAFEEADFAILYREVEDSGTTSNDELWSVPQSWCLEIAKLLRSPPENAATSEAIRDAIMGAAKLVTHDHETAYRIANYAMETIASVSRDAGEEAAIWKANCLAAIKQLHEALDVIEDIDSECLLPPQLKDLVDEVLAYRTGAKK